MKYSSSLLKKYISINDTPENIANHLTLKTCEIEGVQTRTLADSLVIGRIKTITKHPDADKLNVCIVECGKNNEYQIICGGENVAEGLFVPVALPGTFLPSLGFTIEPRKMRGLESKGMICSKQEIGINEDTEKHRIWALNADFDDLNEEDLGKPLKEKYPRIEGFVFEVDSKSLTNRPDLTGHFGIAAELNAIYSGAQTNGISAIAFNKITDYYKQFLHTPILETLENSTKSARKVENKSDGLKSYILLEINTIKIKANDLFARLQMLDMGSTPRNNRVDFSNLFMLISGQPMHFFDADKVQGDITVRDAKEGEEFVDLFGASHVLHPADIVITDEKKILALAGVVGGMEAGVSDTTKNILVEIANFDAVRVRKTGSRLGLRTDAELRFEKHINPVYSLYCLLLFLDELKYYAKDLGEYQIGGLDFFVSKEVQKEIKNPKKITLHYESLSEFIFGKKIASLEKGNQDFENLCVKYLEGLGFILGKKGDWGVPCRRSPDDINIPEDIYEEAARLYGYERIPSLPLLAEINNTPYTQEVWIQRALEDTLVRNFHAVQTETYPWISQKLADAFDTEKHQLYTLQNPVNPEMPYMRDSMVYSLLAPTAKNSKFFDTSTMFDIGKVRNKNLKANGEGIADQFASSFVNECTELGIMIYQKEISSREKDPFLYAKNMVNQIFKELGIEGKIEFQAAASHAYHPKKQITISIEGTRFGFLGSLHPLLLKSQKMPENAGVVYVGLDIDQILLSLKNNSQHEYHFETLQDQIVYRDLCFVVDEKQEFGGVLNAVRKVNEIKDIEVFDLYKGANLGENKKSVSLKMKIVGNGASMTTEQINEIMNKAIMAGEGAGGKLRE